MNQTLLSRKKKEIIRSASGADPNDGRPVQVYPDGSAKQSSKTFPNDDTDAYVNELGELYAAWEH
jgi:hypothetical protein